MKILFSKTFEKQFEKYDKKLQKRIFNAIEKLPQGDIKKLTTSEEPPIYRLRVGKYRVLFYMNEKEIKILKIDSRRQIYK
ncbi:type II toxin-antitoxin system RelE family toxin [Caminibacter sp.]